MMVINRSDKNRINIKKVNPKNSKKNIKSIKKTNQSNTKTKNNNSGVKRNKNIVKPIKKIHKKYHHPLLIFFLIAILLFTVSYQYGKLNKTYEAKRIAATFITDKNPDFAIEYCRKMEYKNYQCFDMYIDAKRLLNEKYDNHLCKEINVGKLPWWSSLEDERGALVDFRIVRDKCYE